MNQLSIRILIFWSLFLISWLILKYSFSSSVSSKIFSSKFIKSSSKPKPTIARVLYLFLCENQNEVNMYIRAFPSISADVMFLCWKENCIDNNFFKLPTFYTAQWFGRIFSNQSLVSLDPVVGYIQIEPRVFIINERQLNLTRRTTWTTARNMLYEKALIEEEKQGWRWAYFNFGDGDIHVNCLLANKLLQTNQTNGDELVFAEHFRLFINVQKTLNHTNQIDQCFILFDTFLLSSSPAIGAISGMVIPTIYKNLLTQIVYHIDAMFNAFHRDALPFVLPYCARYDTRSWWTSQAILIYRSLCLYGHVIQFNAVHIARQKHREYPRKGDPWAIDEDMNLVPASLIPLKTYMKQERIVSALVLQHYSGWSLERTNNECQRKHIFLDPTTCKVSENKNTTNS